MAKEKEETNEKPKRYFIVNPAGAIHEVDKAHAEWRLGIVGWRNATAAEVKLLMEQKNQRFDSPICEPYKGTAVPVEVEGIE